MKWFEEWFDSPLYEKIYANRDENEAIRLIDFLVRIIPLDKYPNILDLGCGRGRHSIDMGKRGYSVTGIDLSEEAISTAREKSFSEELRNVSFVVGDMREPYFDTFDAVVNLFTSFGYFNSDEENSQVIKNVSNMLRHEGKFVLDYLNTEKAVKGLVSEEEGRMGKLDYTINRFVDNETLVKTINIRQNGKIHEFTERVKMYRRDWFERVLNESGFILQKVYGDYAGSDFNLEKSPRLLMEAIKI
ncbi:MAG: class I SAM-dependent methyltransferase [Balneolales bacterium]